MQKLNIPVILGTIRKGRKSERVAHLIHDQLLKRSEVESPFVDISEIGFKFDDEGEQAKIPAFSALMQAADGYIIVSPEYNHSYPGSLKMVLDTNFSEYKNKAVGLVTVSDGPWGGVRANENLVNYTQSLGMKPILGNLNFPKIDELFDADGQLIGDLAKTSKRVEKFLDELIELTMKLQPK